MNIDTNKLTITSAHKHLMSGDFSARELAQAYLDVIEKKNKDINAYLEVFDDVLEQATQADKRIASKKNVHLLTGIPLAMKDNILIKGYRCGAASKILEGYYATYDSTVARKLKETGAVFLGRTNMDEFAMGTSTENSAYGPTKNPHDTSRVPGGSSGGSAAAVAMGGALAALGSDTGGSIRQPASFCGLVGLKPTYGAVSRYGLMAMGSSLDQISPLARTMQDAETLFNSIRGLDPHDGTTISPDMYGVAEIPKKFVIGVPEEFAYSKGVSESVVKNFKESIERLKVLGCEIRSVKMHNLPYALPAYYIIMPAEVSSNLARYDGVKFGALEEGEDLMQDYFRTRGRLFGKEARRRIMLGTYVLSAGYYDAYYKKAVAVRNLIRQDFKNVFAEGVHAIATPTAPSPAFKIGEKINDPLQLYVEDIFTVTANISGMPAISLPSGFSLVDGKQLPLGLQLQAPHGREQYLFEIGKKFEKIRGEAE
ncbi:glutaminyl-tRNA synthase (glutamine-hydrolyzing) subunit A [Candidatus Kaiserbacteria bacterium RIFCSPLOWO2_01_FULL_53_17]|uniref:Glutamyl-tRNA(Gln) amidotransferase subunit A n=1 Tax=Candidatus Kaiserbacteria bacterium RIFCSPLOWO2_01_FULL_53_17 TaxID=1798511 RepID=A0A1F6EH04_9BACT|nr:MAG: glutaminyl-tRNA synthase (glutamine-hydrolyzing) subunit A [Candidatus Kaiserbacteria bacterium RIFCSPLOWO2_01_FULL_53_17]